MKKYLLLALCGLLYVAIAQASVTLPQAWIETTQNEPAAMLLLGTVLIGLANAARGKFKDR